MPVSPPPISVQLYSLRNEAAVDFEAVLRHLGEIGYVGVELAGFHGMTPQRFADVVAEAQLRVSSAHVGNAEPEALNAGLDELQSVGCDTVALSFLPPTAFADRDAISGSAELINVAHGIASARGVAFGYHNHFWEFETTIDGCCAWDLLIEQLEPGVFAELDIYWATVGGADPVDVIARLGDRARLLHVKDGPADDPKHPMVAVGSGALDIAQVLRSAPTARWHIVELDHCATDMFEAIAASYTFLTDAGLSTGRR